MVAETSTMHMEHTDAAEAGFHPTKLFLGGITRHTTTKQLRDHFSQYGRVLDCVAMRQPDGRSRGFGYVTLDSIAAADRCLADPQVIDGRLIDMKRAVPENSGNGVAPSAELRTKLPRSSLQAWPDMVGSFGSKAVDADNVVLPWEWPQMGTAPVAGQVWPWAESSLQQAPDCLELLCHPTLAPPGLQPPPAFFDASWPAESPASPTATLSASAKEFFPEAAHAPERHEQQLPSPPADKTKPALGDVTNLANPKAALGDITNLMKAEGPLKLAKTKVAGLVGREGTSFVGSENVPAIPAEMVMKVPPAKRHGLTLNIREDSSEEEDAGIDDGSSDSNEEDRCKSFDVVDVAVTAAQQQLLDHLPSVGSAEHELGTCKRCNFFPKGRCQNGKQCSFCHFDHEKRKLSRQEKRDRRAARTGEELGDEDIESEDAQQATTFAYPILPGLPPIRSTALPGLLQLPTQDGHAMMGYSMPPGLSAPCSFLDAWQPDAEVSPQCSSMPLPTPRSTLVLSTVPMAPMISQSAPTTPSAAALSTVPTPQGSVVSTMSASIKAVPPGLPAPWDVPAEQLATATSAAQATKDACTSGMQTAKEEVRTVSEAANEKSNLSGTKAHRGRTWSREELLGFREAMVEAVEDSC